MKKYLTPCALLLIILILNPTTSAQQALRDTAPASPQNVVNSLSSLPDADALLYINPQRILNEALPKFMPEKDLAGMRQAFEEVRKNAGIDPTKIDYLVVAVRFRKPTADLSFNAPEFLAVTGGDFSAESLLTLARMASGGRLRDETHSGQKLSVMTIEPLVKQAEKTPFLKSFSEVAIAAINPTTAVIGSPGYIRAAIDAAAGTGRITPSSLSSLLRDPNALVSAAGSPWNSFSKSFGLRGTEAAERAARCETQLGDFYLAVTMDVSNFMLRGFINADNPDTAKIVNSLITGLMAQASSIPDPNAQVALKTLTFAAEESDVVIRADLPHQMVLDFIKQQTTKKQEVKTAEPVKKRRTAPVRRKRRRP